MSALEQPTGDPAKELTAAQPEIQVDPAQPEPEATAVPEGGEPTAFDIAAVTDDQIREAIESGDPAKVHELVSGLKGDYTQKTQAISEREQQLQDKSDLYGWAETIEAAWQSNPAEARRLLQGALEQLGPGESTPATAQQPQSGQMSQEQLREQWEAMTPTEQMLVQSLGSMNQQMQQLQQQLGQTSSSIHAREVNDTLARLHSEHGDFDDQRVLQTAQRMGTSDLAAARKVAYYDEDLAKAKASAYGAVQQKRAAPPSSSASGPSGPERKRARSPREAIDLTLAGS